MTVVKAPLDPWLRRAAIGAGVASALWLAAFGAAAQVDARTCGSLANGDHGPFDYRSTRGAELGVVEQYHFTSNVENLIKGQSATIAGDLDYTLRAFPNHHRALLALIRLSKRPGIRPIDLPDRGVECYLERAVRWRPDDTVSRVIYASYLGEKKRQPEAVQQLDAAAGHAGDNAFAHYNIGLAFADLGLFDRALAEAQRALELGFPRMELKQRLVAAGKWIEPVPAAASAPAASAASTQ